MIAKPAPLSAQQARQARSLLGDAEALNPDLSPEILRGQLAFDQRQYPLAERILTSVTRREPLNLQAWVQLTYAAARAGDRRTLIRAARQPLRAVPQASSNRRVRPAPRQRAPAARPGTTRPSCVLQRHVGAGDARGSASSGAGDRRRGAPTRALDGRLHRNRLDEIAAIACGSLVLEPVGDREHPRRRHLERDQARVGRVHQREPDVVLAQQLRVGGLVQARHQPQRRRARARPADARRIEPMPLNSQSPSNTPSASARASAEHAELEHVARGVRLRAGVEQQPPRPTAPPGRLRGRRHRR